MTETPPSDFYSNKLKAVSDSLSAQAELLLFNTSCHSVPEAAAAAGVRPEDLVKNICLLTPDDRLVVVIVKGEDRVNWNLAAREVGAARVRLASAEEILAKTGYPCGGTPSFGYPAEVLIDPRVMEMDIVYTGGGSENALMRLSPVEILRLSGGRLAPVRKSPA